MLELQHVQQRHKQAKEALLQQKLKSLKATQDHSKAPSTSNSDSDDDDSNPD